MEQNLKEVEDGAKKGKREALKDGDEEEDEVNVDDEDTDEGKKGTNKPNISVKVTQTKAKLGQGKTISGLMSIESYDYSMMDELFGILESQHNGEDIEPILSGYFNKIIQALLTKIKIKILHYLLLKREGDVFTKLLSCL